VNPTAHRFAEPRKDVDVLADFYELAVAKRMERELLSTLQEAEYELKEVHDWELSEGRDATEESALRIFASSRRMALAAFSCTRRWASKVFNCAFSDSVIDMVR